MALKSTPEIRLQVWPQSAIPRPSADPFAVADVIGDLLARDQGDGAGQSGVGAPLQWQKQANFTHISDDVRFVQLAGQTTQGSSGAQETHGIGGFTARPKLRFQNCEMAGRIKADPDGSASFPKLRWRRVKGDAWKTVLDDEEPLRTRIFHARQTPNSDVKAVTTTNLLPNQQVRFDLTDLQVATGQTTPARIRLAWGKFASTVLRQDAAPTLEWRPDASSGWQSWRELTEVGAVPMAGKLIVLVERVAGRLVLFYNSVGLDVILADDDRKPLTVVWDAAPLEVTFFGVSGHLGVALLSYLDDAGQPLAPDFARQIKRVGRLSATQVVDGKTSGWRTPGTPVTVTASLTPTLASYACTMFCSPDGTDAPFVTAVQTHWPQTMEAPAPMALDISSAVITAHESSAEPGVMAGAEVTVELNRNLLDLLNLPSDAPGGATWDTYYLIEGGYNPVQLDARWRLSDGTYTPWITRLEGYLYSMAPQTGSVNDQTVSVTLRDPIIRLTKPAAVIDQNWTPLSLLFANNGGAPLYAAQCVQEIIRHALGSAEAARINGNGDPLRFLPQGHMPLISIDTDPMGWYEYQAQSGQAPTSAKLAFYPPFWTYAIDWIKQLQEDDCGKQNLAVFYYGYVGAPVTGAWPAPIYGMIDIILANRPQWAIPDADYSTGDVNLLLSKAEVQHKPEQDYNRWVVASALPGTQKGDTPVPLANIGEARLPSGSTQSMESSWARTAVIETEQVYTPQGAAWIASQIERDAEGRPVRYPTLSFRGDERICGGDLVKPKMVRSLSDQTIHLNDTWFRIIRLENTWNKENYEFTTTAHVFPLSNIELFQAGIS